MPNARRSLPVALLVGALVIAPLCMAPGVDPCGSCVQSFRERLGPEGAYHELALRAGEYQLRARIIEGAVRLRLVATDPRRPPPEVRCREDGQLLYCELRVAVDGTVGLAAEPTAGTGAAEVAFELEPARVRSIGGASRPVTRGVIELTPGPVLAPPWRRGI